jgi:ligand-binding SRPBCC domain-containing protein
MSVHTLTTTQIFPATLQQAWSFFSSPRNLEKITPPHLGFIIRSELPETMYPGLMITYTVHPLLNLPMTWVTEITHVDEGRFFVDEQRIGPYRLWHHEHHFRDLGDGRIEMRDVITYALWGGPLSAPVHSLLVKPQLKSIFAFREEAVRKMFG